MLDEPTLDPAEADDLLPSGYDSGAGADEVPNEESAKDIRHLLGLPNIASMLNDDKLAEIAQAVLQGYDIDEQSRGAWKAKIEKAMDLARQTFEQKDFPFKGAANIKYPLIATASIQFAARAYPNFVKAPEVVKALVIGEDDTGEKAKKAARISQHMSYQCLNEMTEWEEHTDKMLTELPIVGCAFKKTYFDSGKGRNVSEFKSALDVVMNYWAKSMEDVPRISEVFTLYPNHVVERIRQGLWSEFDFSIPASAKTPEQEVAGNDPDQPHVFIEQHGYWDLDDDGYKEPYVFTVHKDTRKVVRIVARYDEQSIQYAPDGRISGIKPEYHYTKFSFMPALDGSIYDTGFGGLLEPINRAINSILNQLMDSGTLYNLNAGFMAKTIQLNRGRGGGKVEFELGEWKHVNFTGDDLRKNLVPLPVKEPSGVLFNLLGFMVNAGDKLSSVTEILTGEQSNKEEKPTTTLARIEQGLKVFSAIHKRLYRAFREEYKKLFALNAKYLDDQAYFRILDMNVQQPIPPQAIQQGFQSGVPPQMLAMAQQQQTRMTKQSIARSDYDYTSCDVVPIADPAETTSTEKFAKAQVLLSMMGKGLNDQEILRLFVESLQYAQPDKLLNAPPPPPPPEVLLKQAQMQLEADKFHFEMLKYQMEEAARKAEMGKVLASAQKDLAAAEATEAGTQLDQYKARLEALTAEFDAIYRMKDQQAQQAQGGPIEPDSGTGMGGMEGAPGDEGVLPVPEESPAGAGGMPGAGPELAGPPDAGGFGGAMAGDPGSP